jgi:hypothetical protein
VEKLKQVEAVNAQINREAEVARSKLAIKRLIDSALDVTKFTQKFSNIEDSKRMFIYGFKYIETQSFGQACVLIYSWDKKLKEGSMLFPVYSTANVKLYLENLKSSYTCIKRANQVCYVTYSRNPLLAIEKNGFYYNSSNNKCPSVRIVAQNPNKEITCTKETERQSHELEEIPQSVKIKDCKKVEDLKDGDIYEVRGYTDRSKSKIVNLSGTYYIGTYWLRELVEKEPKHTFNVLAGPLKTTPTKKKCRTFLKQ